MYFLDDRLGLGLVDPVIVASLVLAVLAMAFAVRQRRILRFHPRRGADYHVFRLDLATALLWWGLAQVGTVIGWLLRIEGMRMPIWPYLFLIVGVAIGVIAWLKERRGGWSAEARAEGAGLQTEGGVRGTLEEVAAPPAALGPSLRDGAPSYFQAARTFVVLIDPTRGFAPGASADGEGTNLNVRTLYQRCPPLGCKPNFCTKNYWVS